MAAQQPNTRSFAYAALDTAGVRRTGVVDAESRDAAVARLSAEGRFVVDIRESRGGDTAAAGTSGPKRGSRRPPSQQDLSLFTRRLADLSEAGLPLDRVLQVIAEQSENAVLTHVAEEVYKDVRTGMPVSQAMVRHPRYFNEVFTQTLRAGEATGQFAEVAGRLADFQEKEVARRSQITSALVYPSVLAFTAVSVVGFLLGFVVPRLTGVFQDMGDDLPIMTKILLAGTGFLQHNGLLVGAAIIGLALAFRFWIATPAGKENWDRFLLHAPVIGPVVRKATISRFSRVLGTLVYGGVSILEALEIAGLSAGNRIFLRSAVEVANEVRAGRPIAEAMRDTEAFPPVLTHMVAIGEETGNLPKMLGRVSDSLDFEVDTGMRRLVSLVEPIIVLSMGAFVGFVVLAVMLPIFQAQSLVK